MSVVTIFNAIKGNIEVVYMIAEINAFSKLNKFPDIKKQVNFLGRLQKQLEIELESGSTVKKANCDWAKFSNIWLNPDSLDRVQSELGITGVLQLYNNSLNIMETDFGVALNQICLAGLILTNALLTHLASAL